MGFEPMPSVEDQNSLLYVLPIQEQGINLESGALDHSAILTYLNLLEVYYYITMLCNQNFSLTSGKWQFQRGLLNWIICWKEYEHAYHR